MNKSSTAAACIILLYGTILLFCALWVFSKLVGVVR